MNETSKFLGISAYLHYPDGDAAAEWLSRVLGFGPPDQRKVVRDADGRWQEGELAAGPTRIDISGGRALDSGNGAGAARRRRI
jgi:hypothetical protein